MTILNMVYYTVDSGWKPGANTIAYYPLTATSTTSDMSGNGHNLTNSGISFTTLGNVSCAYNNSSYYMTGNLGVKLSDTSYTINLRAYKTGGTREIYVFMFGGDGNKYHATILQWAGVLNYACWYDDIATSSSYPTGVWKNIVLTYNNSTRAKYIYVNGVQAASGTMNSGYALPDSTFTLFRYNKQSYDYFYGYMSNFIVENKARTAQEIQDYYNLTKANYGL